MPIIKVRSKSPGFRRAGILFTAEGVELDTKDLGKDQLAAIKAEPMLVIEGAKPAKPSEPTDPAERIASVKTAVAKLDKNDAALWTRDGRPSLDVLSDAAGFRVAAAERDQALAEPNAPANT